MRALITGINGFVGTHLANLLLCENIEVIGADRTLRENGPGRQYKVDINDNEALQCLIEDIKPEYIYHLAAPAFIPDSYHNPHKTFESIIFGTVNLLEVIRSKSPYSKLLFVGSSDEYGMYHDVPFQEEMLPDPCTPYASAKVSASVICRQYAQFYDVDVVRTRSFNHMGPGQSPRFVSASMAKQIAELEQSTDSTIVLGNLKTSRDFLDVRDVVRAYHMIMSLPNNRGELYNVCSGHCTSMQKLLEEFLALTDLPQRSGFSIRSEVQLRLFDNILLCGDNTKIRQQTGWAPTYTLQETIASTLNYWRTQV